MTQEEKRSICFMLGYEPGCVPMEASVVIDKLIKTRKNRPLLVMNKQPYLKITWEYEKKDSI